MVELSANCGDPDQTPHSAASDLVLHCLPVTRLPIFLGRRIPQSSCPVLVHILSLVTDNSNALAYVTRRLIG